MLLIRFNPAKLRINIHLYKSLCFFYDLLMQIYASLCKFVYKCLKTIVKSCT